MDCITYKGGYKYQLKEDYTIDVGIRPDRLAENDFLSLTVEGILAIKKGYAWDGPSGPTIDTPNFMRGSLVHDALYQLIRQGHLVRERHKELADRLLQRICRKDGMTAARAWWVYQGVRVGGNPATDPANERPPKRAPGNCS